MFANYKTRFIWSFIFLLGICLIIYKPHGEAGFVLDGHYVVEHNPIIKQPGLEIFKDHNDDNKNIRVIDKNLKLRGLILTKKEFRNWKLG